MNTYKGLGKTLRFVRGAQSYAAVAAEVLILLSFALSGLDVSVGGRLVNLPYLPWIWGAIFALGIDTSFVLSWVRVRSSIVTKKYAALWWSIPLAFGMSFIVFQPVAIQQLQQSLGITFNQSLSNLGVDLNFLVYARSFVAVLLGAILAMTNVESHVTPAENTASLVSQSEDMVSLTVTENVALADSTGRLLSLPVTAVSHDVTENVPDVPVSHLLSSGVSLADIADMRGVTVRTVRRWLAKERVA